MFVEPRKPKTTLFTMFFASGSKKIVFTVFFGQHQAKTLACTLFSACCKKLLFHAKSQNHVNYSVLSLFLGFVTGWEGGLGGYLK